MSEKKCLIAIGELARRTCSTPRTLRYYEQLGLIQPTERTEGGFRLYDSAIVADISCIQDLKLAGLSLEDIALLKKPADWCRITPERSRELDRAFSQQQDVVRERIQRLVELLGSLELARSRIRGCQECSRETDRNGCIECLGSEGGVPRILAALLR